MATDIKFLSYRELLQQRALAERAVRRGRNVSKSAALVDRITAELDRRRDLKRASAASDITPPPHE